MGQVLATNPSSSNPSISYKIIKGADGIIYCDCPGWKMRKTCKHLVAFGAGSTPVPQPGQSSKPKKVKTVKASTLIPGAEVNQKTFVSDDFQSLGWYQGCGALVEGNLPTMISSLKEFESHGKYVAEPKLDGIWIAAFSDGKSNRFWSRNCLEKPYGLTDKPLPPGTMLIGELGFGSEYALTRRKEYGHDFMDVFGILYLDYKPLFDLDETERRKKLEEFYTTLSADMKKHFRLVPRYTTGFVNVFDGEHEGLVLKLASGPETKYVGNKNKVAHWLKVKKWYEADMVVIDIRLSDAKTKVSVPMTRDLVLGQYVNGVLKPLTKVGGGITDTLSKDLASNFASYKGKVVKVAHYGQFKSGALRHAEILDFRDDKDPQECVFDPDSVKYDVES